MSPGLPTTSCGKDCHEQSARIQNQLTELGIDKQFSKEELLLLDSDIQRAYKSKQRCEICTKNDGSVIDCCQILAKYDTNLERMYFPARPCPKAKTILADIRGRNEAEHLLAQLNISPRFRSRRFSNFCAGDGNQRAYEVARDWSANFNREDGQGFLIYGNTGNGKTHLAVAAMLEVHESFHLPAIFAVAPAVFNRLKQLIRTPEEYARILDAYMNIPLLVLDDIDKVSQNQGKLSPWSKETMYLLINHRYEFLLPTICTSNLSPQKLRPLLGDAIISRMMEMMTCVENTGIDVRLLNLMEEN